MIEIQKAYRQQKAALTRAVNAKDPVKIKAAVTKAVREWNTWPGAAWPDDWSRWQRALDDSGCHQLLEDL
jgi:hypothetical protein